MQARKAGIHPARIGLDDGTLFRGRLLHDRERDFPEAEQARLTILLHGDLAEQLGQLAPGQPPRQVHLEEPVLAVHEPGAISQVDPVRRSDRGHAQPVTFDLDRRRPGSPRRACRRAAGSEARNTPCTMASGARISTATRHENVMFEPQRGHAPGLTPPRNLENLHRVGTARGARQLALRQNHEIVVLHELQLEQPREDRAVQLLQWSRSW